MSVSELNRREMMAKTAKIIAGLTLAGGCAGPGSKLPAGGRGFKIGVCDWTAGQQGKLASFAVAKRIGVDGVQLSFNTADDESLLYRAEEQKKFLAEAEKQQVQISSIAIGRLNDIPLKGGDPRPERWVSESIDVCKALGVSVVLMAFFAKGDLLGDKRGTDVVVEKLKRIAPKAEKFGVYLAIESRLSAEEHLDIIHRVASPAVKVYYDVANSTKNGYDIYKEIRMLGGQIAEFHMKDYDGLYGKGSIDFPAVRKAIDDIGYRGWLVIEGGKTPLGLEPSLRYDAEYLRKVFSAKV